MVMVCPSGSNTGCETGTTLMPQFTARDLMSSSSYVITVNSMIALPSENCVSQRCDNNTATGRAFPEGLLAKVISCISA